MEIFYENYKGYIYGIGFLLVGIGILKYMKYEKSKESNLYKENKDSIDKNLDFRRYMTGYFCVISGIFILLRELFS
ncbi:hypothetical protein [Apibacter mensalis]|uniref:hypothetical protein n=1 Tax=Apibacter mensalis TaxID=1586267 RepID=UPI0026E9DD08|nr:hypothetical protein [Apibacter mensalis]